MRSLLRRRAEPETVTDDPDAVAVLHDEPVVGELSEDDPTAAELDIAELDVEEPAELDLDPDDQHESDSVTDDPDDEQPDDEAADPPLWRPKRHYPAVVFVALPVVALVIACAVGFFKWQAESMQAADLAAIETVQIASETTVQMLSYQPDTVEADLGSARDRLAGSFRDDYTALINDVVIPGSKEKNISATATVPAASSVSATAQHAVVLVYVNQSILVGNDAPTSTASSVRVTLDRQDSRWMITSFEPI